MNVHVLFENPDWLPPLRQALAAKELDVVEHFIDGGAIDLLSAPPEGVYINRMSPSAHTRDHAGGVAFTREYLALLEAHGRRVINGGSAFAFEVSKVRQHAALEAAGIRTPRTVAVIGRDRLKAAARGMELPFITKHNQGGKGLGVQLFQSYDAFDDYVDGDDFLDSPDGVTLLQQYIEPARGYITRVEIVDGRFLYAIRSSTAGGFQLCPADACQVGDDFCPVGEGASDDGRFQLASEVTADDPLVRAYVAFCAAHDIDVAGIEFVEGADGQRYTYDVNCCSNYNGDVEAQHGVSGMEAVADLCVRELAAVGA